jgi:hypothetical protein
MTGIERGEFRDVFVAVHESGYGTHRRFNDVRSYVGSWG